MIESLWIANWINYFSQIEEIDWWYKWKLLNSNQAIVFETTELYTNKDMCKLYIQDKFNKIKMKPVIAPMNR